MNTNNVDKKDLYYLLITLAVFMFLTLLLVIQLNQSRDNERYLMQQIEQLRK